MTSEPIKDAVTGLLTEAAVATAKMDWSQVASLAAAALKLDPENAAALRFMSLANKDERADTASDKLESIQQKVQTALSAKDQIKAEALVKGHLAKNPGDSEGLKLQNIVLEARQKPVAERRLDDANIRSGLNPVSSRKGFSDVPVNVRRCTKCNHPCEDWKCAKCGAINPTPAFWAAMVVGVPSFAVIAGWVVYSALISQ